MSLKMHRLLQRQIKKILGTTSLEQLDSKLQKLLTQVSDVYEDFEDQRRMSEHIITVNSEELRNSNTQLKQLLEEQSHENKEIINLLHQYKQAIDKSLIVSRTDAKGIITYANDKFCETSGYTKEELIGHSHNIVKDPKNPPELYKDIWQTITQKKIWTGTFSNRKKNGDIYYVSSTIIPLVDSEGKIQEFMGLRDEITTRIEYQKKLKAQSQRIHTIFNSQEHITIIINTQGDIVDVNDKFFETFGFQSLEEYKQNFSSLDELFKEKEELQPDNNFGLKWYEQFISTPDTIHKVRRDDEYGNEQIFKVTCKKIELNQTMHILATLIDITELEHARQKAESAQKAKSIFMANMSHEIRTPLNAIIGFADILTLAKLEPEQKEYANIISKSALSLLDIVDDVLDISKIESGKLEINKEVFPVNTLMDHIVELFSIKAQEKKIRFIYDADPSIPYSIYTDSTRLRQVLSNLLSNAIKFTPEYGHVTYSMQLISKMKNKAHIEFKVTDTGIGISKEQQALVFDPFAQADSGISRNYGGTGLGLAICKDIIALLGSKIKLESTLNVGSSFSFILEVNIEKEEDEALHHYEHLQFALSNIKNDNEHLKMNVKNYLEKIGQVQEFDDTNSNEDFDYFFCFENDNLENELQKFKVLNKDARIIFVGNKTHLENNPIQNDINLYLDLPIYGSKIFNLISDNSSIQPHIITLDSKPSETKINPKDTIHILVAEDNPNNQKLIEILLQKLGMNCTIVNNGQEAIEAYNNYQYDLILMDINMPILDGVSATKAILKQQEEQNSYKVPIIALTANTIEGDKEKYLYAGMDDYLAKPIIFDKLQKMIEYHTSLPTKNKSHAFSNSPKNFKFNIEQTMKQLNLDKETSLMLLENFFLTVKADINELEQIIETQDYESVFKQAHYIKGSSLNLGLNEVAQLLETIEEQAKNQEDSTTTLQALKECLQNNEEQMTAV